MFLVTLGSIEAQLFAIATIGFSIAVFIDEKLRNRKYAKDWNDGLTQHPSTKKDNDL